MVQQEHEGGKMKGPSGNHPEGPFFNQVLRID